MPIRIKGAVLIAIAVILAGQTVLEPWYHTSTEEQPYSPVWQYVDILSAIAIVLGVIATFRAKAAIPDDDSVTWGRLSANAQFYGIIFVGILFLWNWTLVFTSTTYTAVPAGTISLVWIAIDAALPILIGSVGVGLLKAHARSRA